MLNIYITNLGKYVEGCLIGEWVELPVSQEELDAVYERIGINEQYEEVFITDYETDMGITVGEYDSIDKLNEWAETFDGLDKYEQEIVSALVSHGYTLENAIDMADDCHVYSNCSSMTDVACRVIDELGGVEHLDRDTLELYFDFEAYARDLDINGHFIGTNDGYIEVIE